MSKVFDEFSADCDEGTPDAAFELVDMMEAGDWAQLARTWRDHDVGWRENCAYVLGHGPTVGLPVLAEMVLDAEKSVAREAADGLCAVIATAATEDEGPSFALSGSVMARVEALADHDLPEYHVFREWATKQGETS